MRSSYAILRDIVDDWARDEFHDVPLALIDEARELVGRDLAPVEK